MAQLSKTEYVVSSISEIPGADSHVRLSFRRPTMEGPAADPILDGYNQQVIEATKAPKVGTRVEVVVNTVTTTGS